MLDMLACLLVHVLSVFARVLSVSTWRMLNCKLGLLACLRACHVFSYLHIHVLGMLECSRAGRAHMLSVLACV